VASKITGISTSKTSAQKMASVYSRHIAAFQASISRALAVGQITTQQANDLTTFMDSCQLVIPTLSILNTRQQQGL